MSTRAVVGHGATDRTRRTGNSLVMPAIRAGLILTVIATIVPYVDRATSNTLADHIRAGYPTYSQDRIDTAALTDLLIKDTSGDTGLPVLIGWAGVLPCLPGLLVVTTLWTGERE